MMYEMALIKLDIKQRKEDKEKKKVREGQWVKNDYKVVHRCTRCAGRTEKGLKCKVCISQLCLDWLSRSEIQLETAMDR